MTTHEALSLLPNTLVHFKFLIDENGPPATGTASPVEHNQIRVKWDDLVEPDSIVSTFDRMLLATILLTDAPKEPGS